MFEPVVRTHALCKRFGAKKVLEDVSTSAVAGDVVAVLGKNGAGKTTLLELLLGFAPPTSGTAEVLGHPSMALPEDIKARIGFAPQQDELVDILTGEQQLKLVQSFHERWDRGLVERLTREWQVPTTRRVSTLSVGERQKLSLLSALGHRPKLLVLDEPVASLDPIARRDFLRQLLDTAEQEKRTVLFSSHIVSDLERAANKAWIVKDGRLAWQGDLDALKESVVRLHIRAQRALPQDIVVPGAMARRIEGSSAVVAVADWQSAQRAALAARLEATIEVEPLGLEEIFIELHA
jgi:ABC-2 type transport system ATP-binding protein